MVLRWRHWIVHVSPVWKSHIIVVSVHCWASSFDCSSCTLQLARSGLPPPRHCRCLPTTFCQFRTYEPIIRGVPRLINAYLHCLWEVKMNRIQGVAMVRKDVRKWILWRFSRCHAPPGTFGRRHITLPLALSRFSKCSNKRRGCH